MMSEDLAEPDITAATSNAELADEFARLSSQLQGLDVLEDAWKQLEEANQSCLLDGPARSWIACAVYSTLSTSKPSNRLGCSLSSLLKATDISPLEFFDKMNRWKEMTKGARRIYEHTQRMQSSLSVTAVVFKRLLPIWRSMFVMTGDESSDEEAHKIFSAAWLAFLLLKKSYADSGSEDLIGVFHLLLCVIELFFKDLQSTGCNNLMPELLSMDKDTDVLELLCKQFNGIVLDGKHLRTHWFAEKSHELLSIRYPLNLQENVDEYTKQWSMDYEDRLDKRGELDERLFVPDHPEDVFDVLFEMRSVDELRRSLGPSGNEFDAFFYLRLSTQNCLNRLKEREGSVPNSYSVNAEQTSPIHGQTLSEYKRNKLAVVIPQGWSIDGSDLERMLSQVRDNPLPSIKVTLNALKDQLEKALNSPEEEEDIQRDVSLVNIKKHLSELSTHLFFRLLERMAFSERERSKDFHFVNMFRKEELLKSLFAISLEIILDTYCCQKLFPWCIEIFKIQPISFYKIIEIVIRAEPMLARDTVKHLSSVEESILEELAWACDSPLWSILARRADGVPSSESLASADQERRLASQYSPVKKRRGEDGRPLQRGTRTVGSAFFRKIYLLGAARLSDLCERLKMDEKGRQRVWTIFEHTLRTETNLYAGRHMDQNLCCIIYMAGKLSRGPEITFGEIIQQYRQQPQATSRIYRELFLDPSQLPPDFDSSAFPDAANGVLLDLIKYYNHVFVKRLQEVAAKLETPEGSVQLLHFPHLHGTTEPPMKKVIAERVRVAPLSILPPSSAVRTLKYNTTKSPVKDLKAMNTMVRRGGHVSPFNPASSHRPPGPLSTRY